MIMMTEKERNAIKARRRKRKEFERLVRKINKNIKEKEVLVK